jgi:hypothetical protein
MSKKHSRFATPSLANLPSQAIHGLPLGRSDATFSRVGDPSGPRPMAPSNQFVLIIADNFHYQDESEVYQKGPYLNFAAALAEAKDIVDQFLKAEYKPGMTAEKLYAQYTSFGDDPAIVGPGIQGVPFSAWTYAKQRSEEICAQPPTFAQSSTTNLPTRKSIWQRILHPFQSS